MSGILDWKVASGKRALFFLIPEKCGFNEDEMWELIVWVVLNE